MSRIPAAATCNLAQPNLALESAQAAFSEIELLHQRGLLARDAGFLLLVGQSGCGKSTILENYEALHPRKEIGGVTHVPVLRMEVPGVPTGKKLDSLPLRALGDPVPDRDPDRIYKMLDACHVEIVLIDELHNLLVDDARKPIARATNALKTFINKAGRPVVVAGLPRARRVVDATCELKRRFSASHYVAPMELDGLGNGDEFRSVLKKLHGRITQLGIDCIPLHDRNIARRFSWASRGLIDYVVKILERAVALTAIANARYIDLETLGQAFKDKVWAAAPPDLNPFLTTLVLERLDRRGEPFDQWEKPEDYGLCPPGDAP